MKKAVSVIGIIVAGLGLVWLIQGNSFFMYRFFAPKYEEVRRQVFENTPSYKWGMIQELENMKFKYEQANPEQKDALAAIILHRTSVYGEDRLPSDLHTFVKQLKNHRSLSYDKK